jgi:hypothetical protein
MPSYIRDQGPHTPAPWSRREGELWGANGRRVVFARSHASVRMGSPADAEELANGRIADAGADPYEALKRCIPILERLDTLGHLEGQFTELNEGRAAIAKAEGS